MNLHYEYFNSNQITEDNAIEFLKGRKKGAFFLLFYKENCPACVDVLPQIEALVKKNDIIEENLYYISLKCKHSKALHDKYRVKQWPFLAIVSESTVVASIVGTPIVRYLMEIF